MLYVPGSTSTSTGFPPVSTMVFRVAAKVMGVVITSSPGLSSSAWQHKMQSRRGRRERQSVGRRAVGLQVLLELFDPRAGRDPAGLEAGDDLVDRLLADGRPGKGKELFVRIDMVSLDELRINKVNAGNTKMSGIQCIGFCLICGYKVSRFSFSSRNTRPR